MPVTYLVLGASGMLGNACLRALGANGDRVVGTIRNVASASLFSEDLRGQLIPNVDAGDFDSIMHVMARVRPDIVVNCIGMVKQLEDSRNPLVALPLNALFPHRLHQLCQVAGTRLIHISTDCVFSGERGMYRETDRPDADDLYGISKRLGEVLGPGAVTLRTSIIGHELASSRSLIDWFLSQEGRTKGYTRAIYSGLPTVELVRIVRDIVAPRRDLEGLFHVSSDPINKFDLLTLVAQVYGKSIRIEPSERVVIDRSLDSSVFKAVAGYSPPSWPELVRQMQAFG